MQEAGVDFQQGAELAAGNHPADPLDGREIRELGAAADEDLRVPRSTLDDRPVGRKVDPERLLAEHMLARLDRRAEHLLVQLVRQLLQVGHWSGVAPGELQDYAAELEGEAREALSVQMSAAVCEDGSQAGRGASSPASVLAAMARIRAAAQLVVREICLRLEAHPPVDYWQA